MLVILSKLSSLADFWTFPCLSQKNMRQFSLDNDVGLYTGLKSKPSAIPKYKYFMAYTYICHYCDVPWILSVVYPDAVVKQCYN